ncbi:MAG: hypothetical protein WC517_04115 [Patescibacteria group bacterium]
MIYGRLSAQLRSLIAPAKMITTTPQQGTMNKYQYCPSYKFHGPKIIIPAPIPINATSDTSSRIQIAATAQINTVPMPIIIPTITTSAPVIIPTITASAVFTFIFSLCLVRPISDY